MLRRPSEGDVSRAPCRESDPSAGGSAPNSTSGASTATSGFSPFSWMTASFGVRYRVVDSHSPLPSGSFTSSCAAARPSVRSPTRVVRPFVDQCRGEHLGGARRAIVDEQQSGAASAVRSPSASIGVFCTVARLPRGEHAARDEQPRGRDALIECTFGGAAQVDERLFGALLARPRRTARESARRVRSEGGHADEADARPDNAARDGQASASPPARAPPCAARRRCRAGS